MASIPKNWKKYYVEKDTKDRAQGLHPIAPYMYLNNRIRKGLFTFFLNNVNKARIR